MSRTHPKPSAASNRPSHPAKPAKKAAGAVKEAAKAAAPPAPKRPTGAVLWASDLMKEYGDLPALAPFTLTIRPNEAVVLIGHNGSGKTTFLRMAAGLLEPSTGIIELGGDAAGSIGARAAVSYVSDNPTFYEDLSVWEHMEYVARLNGRDEWEQDAADLLGHLGIYERADDLPVTFSRGLRQKTALALAWCDRSTSCSWTSRSSVSTRPGKQALLELSTRSTPTAPPSSWRRTSSSSCSASPAASPSVTGRSLTTVPPPGSTCSAW